MVGVPGAGRTGDAFRRLLELPDIDIASEFANLIVAQRGFEGRRQRGDDVRSDYAGQDCAEAVEGMRLFTWLRPFAEDSHEDSLTKVQILPTESSLMSD